MDRFKRGDRLTTELWERVDQFSDLFLANFDRFDIIEQRRVLIGLNMIRQVLRSEVGNNIEEGQYVGRA